MANMRALRTLAVATITAATLGLTAVPAHADTQTKKDASGDVVGLEDGGGNGTAADRRRTDVLSLTGDHGDGRLRFTFTMADTSQARGGSFLSAQARFVTTDGSEYYASLERVGGGDATTALRREGQPVTCRGLAGRVVSAKDRYVLVVPRSCVGNPDAVRFGGVVNYLTPSSTILGDDARRDGTTGRDARLGTTALRNN
jgi:hypothetical protein